jgi:thiamine-phosphate pyrophosphorylase
MRAAQALALYLVTDRAMCARQGLEHVVAEAVAGGATMVQLRDDLTPTGELIAIARRLCAALAATGTPLIVNNRLDVARAAGADGVHVGALDAPPELARAVVGRGGLVGVSVTSSARLEEIDRSLVDYLGVGPIFGTATKPNADPPIGVAGLAAIRARTSLPIVAIGGIDEDRAREVMAAGADGVAVVSAICAADDPRAAASRLALIVDEALARRPDREPAPLSS